MTGLKIFLLGTLAMAGGALTASGFFALLTSVGVLNRFAKTTHTARYIKLYETMIVLGAFLGTVLVLFHWSLDIGEFWGALYGIIAGIFVGCFAVCLSETIKALPIFIRRVRISTGLGYIILCMAVGKGIGSLLYYFVWYPK